MSIFELGLILAVASVAAILSRKIRLPYSAGLVAVGVALALLGIGPDLSLTQGLIFTVLLPVLIFEAALHLKWRPFRDDLPLTLTLAFPGVAIGAALIALGMHLLAGWSWLASLMFGTLIAATDPVSVIAAFKEMKVEPRLGLLVETESLLNDGAAAVGFSLLVAVAHGNAPTPLAIAQSLSWMTCGSVVVGSLTAGAVLLLAWRTTDHLVELTLTTLAAFGSFLIAERLHMSGVLAALAAGLVVANIGWKGMISETARVYILSFWEFAAFIANVLVFVLIGGYEAHAGAGLLTAAAAYAIALAIFARAGAIYLCCAFFKRSKWAVSLSTQHILVWGGLRGALGLALSLAIPDSLPEKPQMILATFAVVAFSIFVQGLTMPALARRLKVVPVQKNVPPKSVSVP